MKVFESSDLEALHDVGVDVGEGEGESEVTNDANAIDQPKPSDDGKMRVSRKEYIRITCLLENFFKCEQKFERLEAIANYLSEQAKAAKKSLEECEVEKFYLFADLRKVCRGDSLAGLADSLVVDEPAKDGSQGDESTGVVSSPSSDDNAWRSISTAVLFDPPIKGCGDKKRDAIVDQCPTLGHFEDLRCRVGRDADSLHKLLPKGVGLELASELEERLLSAIQRGVVTSQPAAEDADDSESETESSDEPASDEDEVKQIAGRVAELRDELADTIDVACDSDNWKSGCRAREDGEDAFACPWTAGEEQDEWLAGWIAADVEAEQADADAKEPEMVSALDDL